MLAGGFGIAAMATGYLVMRWHAEFTHEIETSRLLDGIRGQEHHSSSIVRLSAYEDEFSEPTDWQASE